MTRKEKSKIINISDLCDEVTSILPLFDDGLEFMCSREQSTQVKGDWVITFSLEGIQKRIENINFMCDELLKRCSVR